MPTTFERVSDEIRLTRSAAQSLRVAVNPELLSRRVDQLVTPDFNGSRGNSRKNERDGQPCGASWPSLNSLDVCFGENDLRLASHRRESCQLATFELGKTDHCPGPTPITFTR